MPRQIFVVIATVGSPGDDSTYPVAAFGKQEKANEHAEKAQAWITAERDRVMRGLLRKETAFEEKVSPFDSECHVSRFPDDTLYEVKEITLMDE